MKRILTCAGVGAVFTALVLSPGCAAKNTKPSEPEGSRSAYSVPAEAGKTDPPPNYEIKSVKSNGIELFIAQSAPVSVPDVGWPPTTLVIENGILCGYFTEGDTRRPVGVVLPVGSVHENNAILVSGSLSLPIGKPNTSVKHSLFIKQVNPTDETLRVATACKAAPKDVLIYAAQPKA